MNLKKIIIGALLILIAGLTIFVIFKTAKMNDIKSKSKDDFNSKIDIAYLKNIDYCFIRTGENN